MIFHLFLDGWLILLIPAVISHIFNPAEELAEPTGTAANKAKVEIETCTDNRNENKKILITFFHSLSLSYVLFFFKDNFLFQLFFNLIFKAYVSFCHICIKVLIYYLFIFLIVTSRKYIGIVWQSFSCNHKFYESNAKNPHMTESWNCILNMLQVIDLFQKLLNTPWRIYSIPKE